MKRLGIFLHVCLISLLWKTGYAAEPSHCEPLTLQRVYVDENVQQVNALKIGRYFISQGLDSYAVNGRILLPLSLIAEAIGLEVMLNNDNLVIDGTDEHCQLAITLQKSPFDLGAMPIQSDVKLWAQDEFDIYLDTAFLETLFQGKATHSLAALLVTIETDATVTLANQQKSARPQTHILRAKPKYFIDDQYHLSTFPTADVDLRYRYKDENADGDYNARVNAYFDTLYHGTELRLNETDDTSSQRLKFFRDVRLGGERAPISNIGYELGDVFTTPDNLIAGSNLGAGLFLYTGDKNQFNAFNSISIQETVSPNWRGELYRNGQFIEAQNANEENQLVFNSVPAFFGPNRYELRLFGPDGQEETRIRTYQMGRDQLVKNKLDIEVYSVNPGENFIDNDSNLSSIYTQANKVGVNYGVSQDLTAGIAFQSLDHITDGMQNYVTASVYKQYGPGAFNLELGSELGDGYGIFGGYSGYWKNKYNVSFDVAHYHDFTSQLRSDSSDLETQLRARISGSADWWGGLGWNASLAQQFNETGEDNLQALFSTTKSLPSGALSSSFSYNQRNGFDRLNNNLYWVQNTRFGSLSVGLNWYPFDGMDINSGNIEARWATDDRLFQITRLQYLPDSDDKYRLNHQLNWRTRQFTLTSGVTVNEHGDWEFSAGFVTSIGYDYVKKVPRFSHKKSSNSGNLHMLAFLDHDRNHQLTAGDHALQNVKFAGNSDWQSVSTDKYGQAILMGASVSGQQLVGVDLASLQDPFLYPTHEKLAVKTHPGGLNRIMLPVLSFSDIEGSVYVEDDFGTRGAMGVPIRLLEGETIAYQATSETDGYYAFSKVSPGEYHISVDPDYLAKKSLHIKAMPEVIEVEEVGDIIWLSDLILTRHAQAKSTSEFTAPQKSQQVAVGAAQTKTPTLGYLVQVGAYKKARSAPVILNAIPPREDGSPFSTAIYRNSDNGMSYITVGKFATRAQASKALASIRRVPSLKGAFIATQTKFNAANFTQQVLDAASSPTKEKAKPLTLEQRKQARLLNRAGKRVCQLGSYQDKDYIRWDLVSKSEDLVVTSRRVGGVLYQVLLQLPPENMTRDEVLLMQNLCERDVHPATNKRGWWRVW
ncbi:SPOR domain-containing protein [Alteromonas sp. a30]|uniref:SPOR domain-containing protein n=1 Tax=Alteromonas sp. a30 TaxID=2730917 RepID=UPI00227EFB77|nr:hypothetical protein [Alteromonas sp. a30]MCY7293936.1 hypothetical protein [Alteromonas sp. a30]